MPAHVVQEAAIDLVDDLQLPRDERLEQLHRPLLQRFRQQGVVGVGERVQRDVPCLIPAQTRLIQQNPHEFRHAERRVRVVHLHGDAVRQRRPVRSLAGEPRHDVLQRAAHQKILLQEAQRPARLGRVVRVQHPGHRFGGHVVDHRAGEVAMGELREIERLRCGGRPQPQRIDAVGAVADDRPVIGDPHQARGTVARELELEPRNSNLAFSGTV